MRMARRVSLVLYKRIVIIDVLFLFDSTILWVQLRYLARMSVIFGFLLPNFTAIEALTNGINRSNEHHLHCN